MANHRAPLLLALALVLAACTPSPTPPPSAVVTIEDAAAAYTAFSARWTAAHSDALNTAAAAADADPGQVAPYAAALAASYTAFADGIRTIEVPGSVEPAVHDELEAVSVLVALANQLESEPTNIAVKTELQAALARVAQRSAAVEALLGISN